MKNIALLLNLFVALLVAAFFGSEYNPVGGFIAGIASFALVSAVLTVSTGACFANNFGVLNNTILINEAFSLFLEEMRFLKNLIIDVQDPTSGVRTGRPGDTITIKDWRTTLTAYQPTNRVYVPQEDINVSAGDRQLTLPNIPWAVSITLTSSEYRLLATGVVSGAAYDTFRNRLVQQMFQALGQKIIDLCFAVVTVANYPNVSNKFVSAAGTFGRSPEIDLDTFFFGKNVPVEGAQVICSPAMYGEWVKDHVAIQTYTGDNRPKSLLMSGGMQSSNSNFTFWRTNRPMPTDAPRAFVTAATGIVAAFRIPDEATFDNDPVSLAQVIDPMAGIGSLARLWKVQNTGDIQLDLAILPVFGKGQTEAVARVLVA